VLSERSVTLDQRFKVELNETRTVVLLFASEDDALIATWLNNAIFLVQVELNETAVSSVLFSQSGNSGALIATWLDNAILFRSG
jgi:hypothetical protein